MLKKFSMIKLIEDWGLPEFLRKYKDEIQYKFDDEGFCDINDSGYHSHDGTVKFCLMIGLLSLNIFTMEFFKASPERNNGRHEIWLELIWVRIDSFRNKGIATHYMKKLIDYAIQEKMDCIRLKAISDAHDFKGHSLEDALPQQELEDFYKKFDSDKMKILVKTLGEYYD